jgi:hypothetical protein
VNRGRGCTTGDSTSSPGSDISLLHSRSADFGCYSEFYPVSTGSSVPVGGGVKLGRGTDRLALFTAKVRRESTI